MLDICEIPSFSLKNLLCKHFLETNFKVVSAIAVSPQGEDVQQIQRWNCMEANTIVHILQKYTGDPMITINVGAMLLPIPLEAAIAQSIKALNGESHNPDSMHTRAITAAP